MRLFLFLTLLLAGLPGIAAPAPAAERPPNIVFILADDLGWRDLGCCGSTFYETPNLDRLASQGMRFTQAYAACNVCSPTRASILTGKYPARLHLTDWLPGESPRPNHRLVSPVILQHLPLEEFTLAEALQKGGYATGLFGKWHLGGADYYPEKQGFEVNRGGCEMGHPHSYFSPYQCPTLKDGPPGEYLTDRLTDEALRFMEEKKDRPFFLYFPHYAVHLPQQAKPEMIKKYQEKAAHLPTSAGPEMAVRHRYQVRQRQDQPIYAAMIESMDESVGRVLAKLSELGLERNTIVIFTSDNGGLSTAQGMPTSNEPLSMGKGWNYEGGIREPLIVKWPGVTKPGTICEAPVISTDYYPTLLEAAAQPAEPQQCLDGVSFAPLLRGASRPPQPLFWHYPHYSDQGGAPGGAVRVGDYKLLEEYENMGVEIYDLKADPGERHNLAADMPDRVQALRQQLHEWRAAVDAQMPSPNPNYRPPGTLRQP